MDQRADEQSYYRRAVRFAHGPLEVAEGDAFRERAIIRYAGTGAHGPYLGDCRGECSVDTSAEESINSGANRCLMTNINVGESTA